MKMLFLLLLAIAVQAAEDKPGPAQQPNPSTAWPQWCGRDDRNMAAHATGLPDRFEEVCEKKPDGRGLLNVRWVKPIGAKKLVQWEAKDNKQRTVFSSPVVAGGKVYIGSCPEGSGSGGRLDCLRESDGELLWQLRAPRSGLAGHGYGITSTPTVSGDRVYVVAPNGQVICLDVNGLKDGNAGPFTDEGLYFKGETIIKKEVAPDKDGRRVIEGKPAEKPATLGPQDADIVWTFDMCRQVNCWPHNASSGSVIVRGNRVYVPTGSACRPGIGAYIQTSNTRYWSPSVIVLDAATGKLLAAEDTFDFTKIKHGAHASSAMGVVNGKEMLIHSVTGRCCAFDPDLTPTAGGKPATLKVIWDCDYLAPESYPKDASRKGAAKPVYSAETLATPVLYNNRVYASVGHDLHDASTGRFGPGRLVCMDATKTGNITANGIVWSFNAIRGSASTVAIQDGLLYAADASGLVYCLNADTGELYWSHALRQPVWAGMLVADGKVYVATYGAGMTILAAGKEKKVLFEDPNSRSYIASTPAVANGTIYVATQEYLYAISNNNPSNNKGKTK